MFNLEEARDELNKLIAEIEEKGLQLDEEALRQRYREIFWHLSAAWNEREASIDSSSKLDGAAFAELGYRLPWLGPEFTLRKQ